MSFYVFIKFLHILGLVLGYGGVIFTALLSAKSIKDIGLFKATAKITPIFSFSIWTGLALLFVSGVWLENFWFSQEDIFWNQDFLKNAEIKYIYLAKDEIIKPFDAAKNRLKPFFENNEALIYQVAAD